MRPLADFLQTVAPALGDAANALLLGIGHDSAPVQQRQTLHEISLRRHAGADFWGGHGFWKKSARILDGVRLTAFVLGTGRG